MKNQWAFFIIEGLAGKCSLLSPPPPPSFHRFALAPFFTRGPNDSFARPELRSLRTGTFATQAKISCNKVTFILLLYAASLSPAISTLTLLLQTRARQLCSQVGPDSTRSTKNVWNVKNVNFSPASRVLWTLDHVKLTYSSSVD